MHTIDQIDTNFKVNTSIQKDDINFYDVKQAPFRVYGVFYEDGKYRRLPESIAASVSDGVYFLHANTAGGRVRFKTNSPYVAIHAEMPLIGKMPHFALSGSAGFDVYVRIGDEERYAKTFVPPFDISTGYEGVIEWGTSELKEITIHFPLYSEVSNLYIGLSSTATVYEPEPYTIEKAIVYYGSSITQGGCASRPGNAYTNIVSRRLNADHINLGFSGNAKAEEEMIAYIKQLDMSVFVFDYDHNAPSVQHLKQTHERMYCGIRAAQPDLPIVFMSRPKYYLSDEEKQRLEIIRTTYQHARECGDTNVYLIDGKTLMEFAGNEGTVDDCHPTDLGFASMAKAVGGVLENIFKNNGVKV